MEKNPTTTATLQRAKAGEERKLAEQKTQHSHTPVAISAPLAHTIANTGVPIATAQLLANLIATLQARVNSLETAGPHLAAVERR